MVAQDTPGWRFCPLWDYNNNLGSAEEEEEEEEEEKEENEGEGEEDEEEEEEKEEQEEGAKEEGKEEEVEDGVCSLLLELGPGGDAAWITCPPSCLSSCLSSSSCSWSLLPEHRLGEIHPRTQTAG